MPFASRSSFAASQTPSQYEAIIERVSGLRGCWPSGFNAFGSSTCGTPA